MENITKISERIKQFIDYKKLTINKFSDAVGTSNSYFNKLIKNGTTIGSDKIENILRAYPDLNPIWLVTGKGSMLNSYSLLEGSLYFTNDQPEKYEIDENICAKRIRLLQEKIEMLEEKNTFLKENILFLKEKIEYLGNKN
jgi:transcriptional regulator with XRE-family HTH domain